MQEKRYIVEGQDTLLPFLLAHVAGKSRNSVKAMLTRGQVQVDGKPSPATTIPSCRGKR